MSADFKPLPPDSKPRPAAVRDEAIARLMYRQGAGSLVVTVLAALSLAALTREALPARTLLCWLGGLTLVVALRALLLQRGLVWHRDARQALRWFAAGAVTQSLLWAVFPLLFFDALSVSQRAGAGLVLGAIAGGSTGVLAPIAWLSFVYVLGLLLPASLIFMLWPQQAGEVWMGSLGLLFLLVQISYARNTRRAVIESIDLHQEQLVTNQQLALAEAALRDANARLEQRVSERTAALEREVRERQAVSERLRHLASTDSLTELANRAACVELLSAQLAAGERGAVLVIDLDRFKEVNDGLGHSTGDAVLRVVASRLHSLFGDSACLARWGGDEFVVARSGSMVTAETAMELANAAIAALNTPIKLATGIVRLGASVGVALFPEHARSAEALVACADIAVTQAKHAGRLRAQLYAEEWGAHLQQRLSELRDLRVAVANQELSVLYQPILRLSEGGTDSMEALLRWQHPQLGEISPTRFIAMAEDSGLIVELGAQVLRRACADACLWPADLRLAVNVSVRQLESGEFIRDLDTALIESGLPPGRLELEMTESVFAQDSALIGSVLAAVRRRGVGIAIDDFGTGYSSLAYLRHIPAQRLKIDRAFIHDIEHGGRQIIAAVLSIAHSMGLEVVAEGIESPAQLEALRELGLRLGQGWLLGAPLSQAAILERGTEPVRVVGNQAAH